MTKQTLITKAGPPIYRPKVISSALLLTGALLMVFGAKPASAAIITAPVGGEIEKITVNDINDHWSGGVIVAGGQSIIIPRNLLIDLPANRVTLQQLFLEAPVSCQAQHETGLAKGDTCNGSGMGGIATIQATHIDNGNVIAGDVFIEKGAESVSGEITYINHTDGYFRINGNTGTDTGGLMVRLNDPDSRHTIQSGAGCAAGSPNCSPDPRFTLDGDNYTNVFSTGYPLCIPSTKPRNFTDTLGLGVTTTQAQPDGSGDVLCPRTNRPGQPVADSRRFAPILVGDSITAEGNYELINGVKFLSAHSTAVGSALSTKNEPGQPDYLFLDEVEVDAPGFQNQRARTLIIGYATLAPADVLFWSIHYDPKTNSPHEFPLATTYGCDAAGGPGTCTAQGLVGAGANIFKIRHDVDFLVGAKPRVNPCSHLQADFRFAALSPCAENGGTTAEQFAILSPIPHEIQARTGHKYDSLQVGGTALMTVDINGNEATNGQYLFPFGMGLGGVSVPEMNEINLDAMATPISFSGIPWNLDRRLSPGGCLDTNNDGIGECESTPQPLDPFPFEGANMDPRTLGSIPDIAWNDPNYSSSGLNDVRDRILSFVDPSAPRINGNAIGINDSGNFTSAILNWQAPPPASGGPGSGSIPETPSLPQELICSANSAFNSLPLALDDSATTETNLAVSISVLANDSDVNGDVLTIASVSTPNHGQAVIQNGLIVYTPATDFTGNDAFTYTISDGQGQVSANVSVIVNAGTNIPPIATDDDATVVEDNSISIDVLVNDIDNDSGPGNSVLSVISVTPSVNGGTVSIGTDNLSVNYTPKANFTGTDTFEYVVSDGRGGTDTGLVTVTVTPVNDAPVAVNDNASVTAGSAVTIAVLDNDSDVDGDALAVSLALNPTTTALGSFSSNGTTVTYKAKSGVIGTDSIAYSVSDGHGGTASATVTVKVNAFVPDVVSVTRTQFIISKSEWRIEGTGSVGGKTITVRLGTSNTGAIIGTSTVDPLTSTWIIRVRGSSVIPGGTTVKAWSSGGGTATSTITLK